VKITEEILPFVAFIFRNLVPSVSLPVGCSST